MVREELSSLGPDYNTRQGAISSALCFSFLDRCSQDCEDITNEMTVVGYDKLETFWNRHPVSKAPLLRWYRITLLADWRSLADVRRVFAHADHVGDCTVFNIHGNHYRLISKIHYGRQIADVWFVLTHSEYDKGRWKNDCR